MNIKIEKQISESESELLFELFDRLLHNVVEMRIAQIAVGKMSTNEALNISRMWERVVDKILEDFLKFAQDSVAADAVQDTLL